MLARLSKALDKPTTEGLRLLSELPSNIKNILRKFVPASLASVILGAIVSIAATSSLYLTPTELAAPPDFSIALDKYCISADPACDAAANILIYSPATLALSPIWFIDPDKAFAADGTSIPAASAKIMACFVTSLSASLFFNNSGCCEPINL